MLAFTVRSGVAEPLAQRTGVRVDEVPDVGDDALDADLRRAATVRSKLTRQIGLLRERRQALVTAAVTGALKVPGVAA